MRVELSKAILLALTLYIISAPSLLLANVCALPGSDGDQTISGVVNTYYAATASVSAGSTNIGLGSSSGAGEAISTGDLVLIIQMQDASINSSNSISYGDGLSGSGATSINQTGLYEFASVASSGGGSITLTDGLQNSYNQASATLASGQKTYQIIKVPQYFNVTLSGSLSASPWDGEKGGVFVIDVAATLSGGSATIDVSGDGFRGGAYQRNGVATNATERVLYVDDIVSNTHASGRIRHAGKGEGIAGTPQFIYNGSTIEDTNGGSTSDGYPSGDYGRGAPGNAGGGGNEWANGNDSGGGGGANVNAGGQGGAGWDTNPITENVGGLGGSGVNVSASRIVMGGGGGAGLANNSNAPHGGNGGGIIIVRANMISGLATLLANGSDGITAISNDGAGGAGAAGSVVVTATSGLAGLAINAQGGQGGSAWPGHSNTAGAHGPGGGGGGGFIGYSSGAGSPFIAVTAGSSGTTTTSALTFGATDGVSGTSTSPNLVYPCAADLSVTKTDSNTDYTPGASASYTIAVTNNGPTDVVGASLSDVVPDGLVIGAVACSPVLACTAINVVGQTITVTFDVDNGDTVNVTVPVTYSADPTDY